MSSPYQKALIPGPDVGVAVSDPLTMTNIIKKSSNVLVVIGANAVKETIGDITYADKLLEIAKKANATIIATASAYKHFVDIGKKEEVNNMPLINLIDRLRDPEWINIDSEGNKYDLIIFGGFLIYYLSQMLSTLRNYTIYRTVCLDRYHQPNARFSLPNIEKSEWIDYLEEILSKL
ncbi:MAG: CO dehydrogenase/acetyl-CoA synthase complex subunit epsilon [Candidatus Lokiarchaeota archaeon]|nr:CO dehydrogenase/acetyl-CoA synthase complex subunit epsilon [Candidatus Lokiarchaeota archaeon]